MSQAVVVFFDDEADAAVRGLWKRLRDAGVPPADQYPPHLSYASAGSIPRTARAALREELGQLWLPGMALENLSSFVTSENVLMLSAVVDSELLAVHSAIHDVLARKVKNPNAYFLPGHWVPHCTLAVGLTDEQMVTGFGALHPVGPIRAKAGRVCVVDSVTGEVEDLT
ncbi:2'-5' RNA ligase family protein [Umezawaea sp. Da 62-37]|uniref:2'-5' RNA ligase family protein n=1 Tax=Umezawaea sp. Da 62-37 TaxID=3075927 RepID=UPI0028F70CC1|nr:2'-5' RNA ligase family protein [Umezawaea sp. Da 62-37]WNV81890.1 2'-5' RNA ligase family protein [Umezawaea sp. Da 62-37]